MKMLFKETLKWQFFETEIFWEINSWNTLCLLKKKQTPFEFTTLKSWKKNPSNLRCCENCCPLKKCIIEKIQTSETTNIKIKKKSLQIFPLQKKSKLLRCPHQHFLRKPFFLKKSQKLEGLCSNTNAAQPKNPTIQTNKTGKVLVLSCPLSAAIKQKQNNRDLCSASLLLKTLH